MYCASTQARTALTYGKEYLRDGTWELEDDEEEAWESGGNGWDVSPTLLVPELPLLAYKGIMCVAFLPFPTSSSDCTPDPRTELTVRSASKMGDEEEEAAESGGNGWDVSPTLLVLELPLLVYKGFMCVALFCLLPCSPPTVLVNAVTYVALSRQ